MSTDTSEHPPIAKIPYTLAPKDDDWVRDEIDKLLEAGVIRESHSSWSAPIVVVPKGDGGRRLFVDFRALNVITRTYVWPMPRVEDIFAKLGKARFFTTLDLKSGYHHIALNDDAIKKTAFSHHWENMNIWLGSSTHLLSKFHEQGSECAALYPGLSGCSHHLQQVG